MLRGIGWLLVDSQFELADSGWDSFSSTCRRYEASYALFPIRVCR